MIQSKDLTFSYSDEKLFHLPDLYCDKGQALLIKGDSGKGKTTFLHLLSGILRPHTGQVTINSTDIVKLSNRKLDRFRGQNIGVIFQTSFFLNSLTVLENLTMTSWLAFGKKHTDSSLELLDELSLLDQKDKLITQLSIGQQQRVSIARALLNRPKVIFADEPTSSLDDNNAQRVIDLLIKWSKKLESALVIVTHDGRLTAQFSNQLTLV